MFNKQNKSSGTYTSCIKISGVPILPPLITCERRKELQDYKNAAMELEKLLQQRRAEKSSKSNYAPPVKSVCETNQHCYYKTLEQQMAFENDSHADCLKTTLNQLPSEYPKEVPYKNQNSALTFNFIEIAEFGGNGVRLFSTPSASDQAGDTSTINPLIISKACNIDNTTNIKDDSCISSELQIPRRPRIRSNSYTLEAPSPVLLSHFEKEHALQNRSVTDISTPKSPYSLQVSHSVQCNISNSNVTSPSSDEIFRKEVDFLDRANESGCLILDDINCSKNTISDQNVIETKNLSKDTSINTGPQLLNVLNNIPRDYSVQIIELLEKQKVEQRLRLESYEKLKEKFLLGGGSPSNEQHIVNVSCVNVKSCRDRLNNSSFDIFEEYGNNTLTCTPKSTDEALNLLNESTTDLLIDLDDDCSNNTTKEHSVLPHESTFSNHLEILPRQSDNNYDPVYQIDQIVVNRLITNCSREPFLDNHYFLKHQAASKIGAAVKGYLVRRLMRTEKVCSLTQTIKDALICAMDLHSESTENIKEPDVELHRRLIQQVTAACNAFHDVFFTLSTKERMSIIAQDRLRKKKEKLKRSVSASSWKSDSSFMKKMNKV